jgi:hypothetical protein
VATIRKRPVAYILLALVAISAFTTIAAADTATRQRTSAEQLLRLARGANETAYERAALLGDPQAQANYTLGRALLSQAEGNYSIGNYMAAHRLALEAMHTFRNAIRQAEAGLGEQPETPGEQRHALNNSLERAEAYLNRIQQILLAANESNPELVGELNATWTLAYGKLQTAIALLQEGKINETAQLIGHIRSSFNQTMDEIVHLRNSAKEAKINGYLNSVENRIEALRRQADKAPEPQRSAAIGLLTQAEEKLNAARTASGQEAISLLTGAQELIDQAKDELHGKP